MTVQGAILGENKANYSHQQGVPPNGPSNGIVGYTSGARITPKAPSVPFGAVLAQSARTVVQGAEGAMQLVPGGSMVAMALRSVAGTAHAGGVTLGPPTPLGGVSSIGETVGSAEGPGALSSLPSTGAFSGGGTLGASMDRSSAMNMYFLQVQEQVNAQNRTFTTLSNVMKAEHDTVKTAIGNVR